MMSKPTCYHVSPADDGWQARYDHNGSIIQFRTRESAIEAAREAARSHWQLSGLTTCVQIEDAKGTIVDDVSFGSQGRPDEVDTQASNGEGLGPNQ